jgi:hypothetical protein
MSYGARLRRLPSLIGRYVYSSSHRHLFELPAILETFLQEKERIHAAVPSTILRMRILLSAWTQGRKSRTDMGKQLIRDQLHKDEQPNGSFGRLSIHIER